MKRYHALLLRIYKKLRIEYPLLSGDTRLSLAVQALNNTAGPDGLIPTLLVFVMVPKLPLGHIQNLPLTPKERFAAMETACKEMEDIVAKQRLKVAENFPPKEVVPPDLEPDAKVLIFRERLKHWDGPFRFKFYDGYKTAYVEINNQIRPLSVAAIKPYHEKDIIAELDEHIDSNKAHALHQTVYAPNDPRFEEAKAIEITNLLRRETYEVIPTLCLGTLAQECLNTARSCALRSY